MRHSYSPIAMSDIDKAAATGAHHVEIKPFSDAVEDEGARPRGRTQEIRSRALVAALAEENPRPFRKSFLKLYVCLFFAYMCSSTTGFGELRLCCCCSCSCADCRGIDGNTFGSVTVTGSCLLFLN